MRTDYGAGMIRSVLRRHRLIHQLAGRFSARHGADAADRAEIWAIRAERRMDPAFAWQVVGEVRRRLGVRREPTELRRAAACREPFVVRWWWV